MSESLASVVWLSLEIAFASTALGVVPAVVVAYVLSRASFRGKVLVEGLVNLPLVLPPVSTGYLLLLVFGRRGLLGRPLDEVFGITLAFTSAAAVIASAVVAFPLVTRSIRLAFDLVDRRYEEAAAVLGASRLQVLWRVTLPLVLPGILSGSVLGFARSLGEFGATITFAGNIPGETRTIPVAVYSLMELPGEERAAGVLVVCSVLLSFAALAVSSLLTRQTSRVKGPSAS